MIEKLILATVTVLTVVTPAMGEKKITNTYHPSYGMPCYVNDPDGVANIRAMPNGTLVNALKNGRAVYVTGKMRDEQGRSWSYIESEYQGEWRKWGFIFSQNLACN